jgi:hypothetical protein
MVLPQGFSNHHVRLRQGCPLFPFMFLIISEALRKMLLEAKNSGLIRGVKVSTRETISHLLFVDDIFL